MQLSPIYQALLKTLKTFTTHDQWVDSLSTLHAQEQDPQFPYKEIAFQLEMYLNETVTTSKTTELQAYLDHLESKIGENDQTAEVAELIGSLSFFDNIPEWALWLSSNQSRRVTHPALVAQAIHLKLKEFLMTPEANNERYETLKLYLWACESSLEKHGTYPEENREHLSQIIYLSQKG
ncbi:hypothetical protein [Ewingella americana]|uniref:Uncharacterized protein n=1 Tax=Ewingella americana TaxID=41202 RepID=A0A502GDF3_9GAMM|nr:hypothetical protein [Ewingella americana]TPG59894.1 hypothetical protein EAH77_15115 [Ewingella americana]